MHVKGEKQKNSVLFAMFLMAVFFGTWLLTKMTPLVGDDFNYAFSWADDTRVDNFTLVVKSMLSHRLWTHGRVFAQGWVTLFMMWPDWAFPLANATVVTAFFATLYHFFNRTKTRSPLLACVKVAVLYWICMPVFGQVFLWLDGACNYFWGAAFSWILLELMWTAKGNRYAFIWTALLLPLAFAVGAWSEHISFAVLVIQFLMVVADWVQRKKLPVMEGFILLVSCAGYLYLMFAPSMIPSVLKNRATVATKEHLNTLGNFLAGKWWVLVIILIVLIIFVFWLKKKPTWQSRWVVLSETASAICFFMLFFFALKALSTGEIWALVSSAQVGLLFLMGCFFLCLKKTIQYKTEKEIIVRAIIIAVGGACALIPFSVAMYVPARGFCAPVVFIGIAAVMLWNCAKHRSPSCERLVLSVLGGLFLLYFILGMIDIVQVERAAVCREQAIEQALDSDGVLYAAPYPVKTKYSAQYGIQDLAEGEYWPNAIMAKYYGLTDIVVRTAPSKENS